MSSHAGVRLFFLFWAWVWTWMTLWQITRQSWGWAVGNSALAALGLWCYVESIIEDIRLRPEM